MRVTLYKGSMITTAYNEVFDTKNKVSFYDDKTCLEYYLDTLEKRVYELDQVYIVGKGKLNFPLEIPEDYSSIFEYNYMKIEYNSIIRYCFIDSVELANEIGIVFYTEDLWHSFFDKVNLRKSLLINSHITRYKDFEIENKKLPVNYMSDKPCVIKSIEKPEEYYIIANVQYYKLKSSGKITERNLRTVIFNEIDVSEQDRKFTFTLEEAFEFCAKLKSYSSEENMFSKNVPILVKSYEYDVDNIMLLPTCFFRNGLELSNDDFVGRISQANVGLWSKFDTVLYDLESVINRIYLSSIADILIINKPKKYQNMSVGTINNRIELANVSPNTVVKLKLCVSKIEATLLLEANNSIIDITDDFTVNLPFNTITSSENSQRKTSRRLQNLNMIKNALNNFSPKNYYKGVQSGLNYSVSEDTSNQISSNLPTYSSGNSVSYGSNVSSGSSFSTYSTIAKMVIQTGIGISSAYMKYKSVNGKMFTSSNMIEADNCNIFNFINGIVFFELNEINIEQITRTERLLGYEVFEIVDNNIFEVYYQGYTPSYNILRFGAISTYGNIPQDIITFFNEILTRGIKIWYNIQYIDT